VIDLDRIDPKHGDKFSPNLHAWLKAKDRREVVAEGGIYIFGSDDPVLYIGHIFDGELQGARLLSVMTRPREIMGCYSTFGEPVEVADFFERYYAIGRCAVDPKHAIAFESKLGRWEEKGDRRECRWCGQKQWRDTRIKIVRREIWVDSTTELEGERRVTIGDVDIEAHEMEAGWAIFSGCEGEVANFQAYCPDRKTAEFFLKACEVAGLHDEDLLLTDTDIAPATLVEGQVFAANHFDRKKGAEAILEMAQIVGDPAARMRAEVEEP